MDLFRVAESALGLLGFLIEKTQTVIPPTPEQLHVFNTRSSLAMQASDG